MTSPPVTPAALAEGIRARDRIVLARAITLVESAAPKHRPAAEALIQELLPEAGRSRRLGFTGVPGVGKSTLIDAFGCWLCDRGMRLAVLAIDPSSSRSGGSILGDKTRMDKLAQRREAFIRPSPARGTPGGVARATREAILLCEAFGFDVVIVETVGVGQSEIAVRSMVDFFVLLALTGAGDELQGLKKGIMELADCVVVTKADGDNAPRAEATRLEYERILHYLAPYHAGWHPRALSCSAKTGAGLEQIWDAAEAFWLASGGTPGVQQRRSRQDVDWMRALIRDRLEERFYGHAAVRAMLGELEAAILRGERTAMHAADTLLDTFLRGEVPPGPNEKC